MASTVNPSPTAGQPILELGATSPGGLRLPDAKPSASTLYAPRAVCFANDGASLVVADTGNHRVLIWHDLTRAHGPADVVLGQLDFDSEGPNRPGPGRGLHLPTGVAVHGGRLFVCDAWNHRVAVWNALPTEHGTAPDAVLGQPSFEDTTKNRGKDIGPDGLDCPYGIAILDCDLYVADTQNRRVLRWDGVPDGDAPAAAVIGQDDFGAGEENRGRGVGADTMRWPHALATTGRGELLVADAGNHRVLGFEADNDRRGAADVLVGQDGFDHAFEMPHTAQGPGRLRFPYGLAADDRRVCIADTANNRVLTFDAPLRDRAHAKGVLGQLDFDAGGENRWSEITADTLCWPYGIALHGDLLAVADSGNNRVVVWRLAAATSAAGIIAP